MIEQQYLDEAGDLLSPILDLMSGADGGIAFSKLRHQFLPEMLQRYYKDKDFDVEAFITMVKRFSKLCEVMQQP